MDLAIGPNGRTEQTFGCLYCRDTGAICFAEDMRGEVIKLSRVLACTCKKAVRNLGEHGGVFLENGYRRIDQGEAVGRYLDKKWEKHLVDHPDAEKLPCFTPIVSQEDIPF